VLYGDLDARTGGTIYDRIVVDGLRARGDEVHVLSLKQPTRVRDAAALAHDVKKSGAEVVVGDELCFKELAVAFPLLRNAGVRRVLLVHHLTSWEPELSRVSRTVVATVESTALRYSDRIVTTSETTRTRLARSNVSVARPGCDRLKVEPANRGGNVVLFVGAIIPRKRVVELVRAFAKGAHSDARLVIAGTRSADVAYAREVARLVDALGIRARVTMPGELADGELARRFARADVVVMPSSLEGWGIAATEAIRAGAPVIAARTTGLVEALEPCKDATVFFDDEPALAEALRRFTTDPSHRAAMSEAASRCAPHLPTWDACVEAFIGATR